MTTHHKERREDGVRQHEQDDKVQEEQTVRVGKNIDTAIYRDTLPPNTI